MGFFGKILKKDDQTAAGTIPPEIYKSVRVMRDDLNELEGKPPEGIPGAVAPEASDAGHPFLGAHGHPSAPEAPVADTSVAPASKNLKKWLIPAAVVILVLMIGGITAYFFLRSTPENDTVESVPTTEIPSPVDGMQAPTAEPTPAPTSAFSPDSPNYLALDPESDAATPEGIVATLEGVGMKVREMNPSGPVEFLLRDGNNNPIAFSRFSYLMKLGIPEDTLSFLDESFSLYFVPEGSDIRMTLVLDIKDAANLVGAVNRDEAMVPTWFSGLLYRPAGVEVPASVEFRSGTYGALETRFVPIDAAKNYSFDYIFLADKWMIGTSKDSFRATVDAVIKDGVQ